MHNNHVLLSGRSLESNAPHPVCCNYYNTRNWTITYGLKLMFRRDFLTNGTLMVVAKTYNLFKRQS